MSERETFPSERSLLDSREEQASLAQHVAYPGRVQSYDAATQTADVVPLVRQQVPQPDGSYALEALPVLPSVPVVWPRVGGWFLAFQLRAGDTVQLLCNTSAIGHWRTGSGDVTDPGDLRRQHLAHAVAIPGLYTRGRALAHAPSGSDELVMGADSGSGTRVSFRTDGTLVVTHGSTVVLEVDAAGVVHLGAAAGASFVALATAVDSALSTIRAAYNIHVHGGPGTPPTVLLPALPGTAATKAKAT